MKWWQVWFIIQLVRFSHTWWSALVLEEAEKWQDESEFTENTLQYLKLCYNKSMPRGLWGSRVSCVIEAHSDSLLTVRFFVLHAKAMKQMKSILSSREGFRSILGHLQESKRRLKFWKKAESLAMRLFWNIPSAMPTSLRLRMLSLFAAGSRTWFRFFRKIQSLRFWWWGIWRRPAIIWRIRSIDWLIMTAFKKLPIFFWPKRIRTNR